MVHHKKQRFCIRKLTVGADSALIGLSLFYAPAVLADVASQGTADTAILVSQEIEGVSVDSSSDLLTLAELALPVVSSSDKKEAISEAGTETTAPLNLHYTIPQYELPEEYKKDIQKSPGTAEQYLGHPDMIMLDDNRTLLAVYPVGHGHGPLIMQISKDGGKAWERKTDTPKSWSRSLEAPTLYKLDFTDGRQKLILISARPNWAENAAGKAGSQGGWDSSISNDNGKTWTEFQINHPTKEDGQQHYTIVAMASLVQLKDKDGHKINKWMGIFHDYDFVNYKTILSFDENGNQVWTKPEPILKEYRDLERKMQACEIGMFRSPDGKRIVGLIRTNDKNSGYTSAMIYSDDEGLNWSKPKALQGALQGERHKGTYDPISGRLLITFREIQLDWNKNGKIEQDDWMAGDWVAWVGTYEDLMHQNEGQYRILLAKDYAQNRFSGDTGYAGTIVQPDGTFVTISYGHFDEAFSKSWRDLKSGSYNVTTDLSYIKQATFKLSDIDKALGFTKPYGS